LVRSSTIRKVISFFLLILVAISVVPKAYFHDAIADHRDSVEICGDNSKAAHLHQNGINCHFDQLVVTSLYHFSVDRVTEPCTVRFNRYHQKPEPFYYLQPSITRESRGPPSPFMI
jgi:hypothetical protein